MGGRVRAKDAKDAKVRKAITELSFDHTGPKWVRAKGAKGAKVRKAITALFLDHTGWWACGRRGLPGSVSPATTEAAGGAWSADHGTGQWSVCRWGQGDY